MKSKNLLITVVLILISSLYSCKEEVVLKHDNESCPTLSFEEADLRAQELVGKLTLDQKVKLIGGYARFFIHAIPEHNIPAVFLSDATQGLRLSIPMYDSTIVIKLERSTAFPCPLLLASTWNVNLSGEYARAVGEEARAAGVGFLLGPGLNVYRISQCGRNFEYFGEDPYLISRMIENYVKGVQSTGTAATLKHFVANNTDFYRRRSNSIVEERALHEIYTRGFKAGIDAGALGVMTAYNKLNGEWCGQSEYVINNLLREQLGFKWMVMTDWTSVFDGEKVVKSGQDLEMPKAKALSNVMGLLNSGKISIEQIDRMTGSILRTCIATGLHDRVQQDTSYLGNFDDHEQVALQVAGEGIVLLKNEGGILPINKEKEITVLATGKYMKEIAHGGGSAYVQGYNNVTLANALEQEFADKVNIVDNPTDEEISSADLVILSIGTYDSESYDRSFDLPDTYVDHILKITTLNPNTVVIVNSGSGINMSPFIDKVPAVIYGWYGGQIGSVAMARILSGEINPSGKLPITIEKSFEDSPGAGYLPEYEVLYTGGPKDKFTHREYDVEYTEGIFVGYRWYEHKNIEPMFGFGHGLSYTTFEYSNLSAPEEFFKGEEVLVSFTLKNSGDIDGAEIAQLYIQDNESSHPRPLKELKGFKKIFLKVGEEKEVNLTLNVDDFSYWNPDTKEWYSEPGVFNLMIGTASDKILLKKEIILKEK